MTDEERIAALVEEIAMLWRRNDALLKTLAATQRVSEDYRAQRNTLLQRLGEPVPA